MTTTGITKRPAQVRLALGRGVVYGVLGALFAGGTVMLAGATRHTYRQPGMQWIGNDDMSTGLVRLEAGTHTVRWEAPCVLDVDLWLNEAEDVYVGNAGSGMRGSRTMTLDAGNYFLSVGATCDWTASIR